MPFRITNVKNKTRVTSHYYVLVWKSWNPVTTEKVTARLSREKKSPKQLTVSVYFVLMLMTALNKKTKNRSYFTLRNAILIHTPKLKVSHFSVSPFGGSYDLKMRSRSLKLLWTCRAEYKLSTGQKRADRVQSVGETINGNVSEAWQSSALHVGQDNQTCHVSALTHIYIYICISYPTKVR